MDRIQIPPPIPCPPWQGITEKWNQMPVAMDQSSFRWGWFPWRRETCLSRLNRWPGERTPGPASIVTSCVSGFLSCDGLMSLLGNAGSLLSAPMVSLLLPDLVLPGALVQSWLLSVELRVSMSGAAGGCHRNRGGRLPAAQSSQRLACTERRATSTIMGLVVLQHVGSSQTRDSTYISCTGSLIL